MVQQQQVKNNDMEEKNEEEKATEYMDKFNGNKAQAIELVEFHIDYIKNLPYKKSLRFVRKGRVNYWQSIKQLIAATPST